MDKTQQLRRRRSQNGIDQRKIGMRLFPEERREFEDLAMHHRLTDSALARQIYLAGLPVWKEAHDRS